ncbi:MAG: transcription antitermination factor NusB [Verrucomicrobia bacterium]|nr:transcription antitermination factor NusB [Verrucomicrobiota bacterium]
MATRRSCREWVVQLLFQLDLNATENLDSVFAAFWKGKRVDRKGKLFTEDVVRGVRGDLANLDAYIAKVAEHWAIKRMGVIDRNVIRMAIYEMRHMEDVPPIVSINEAVDIAKYFSNKESGKFVNGILDRARRDLEKPSRRAGRGEKV